MVMANAYQKYNAQKVVTANPVTLIVMLYDGCIKQLKLAQLAIDKKDCEATNTHIKKAQDIVSELLNSLDLKFPISQDLMALYEFMLREMRRINTVKNRDDIDPLVGMLSGLRDTWAQVEKTYRPDEYLGDAEL